MNATANCTLSTIVKNKLLLERFGGSCFNSEKDVFSQIYIDNLGCNPKQILCIKEDFCDDSPITFLCNFYINEIVYTDFNTPLLPDRVDFSVSQFYEGVAPYKYFWEFDPLIFTLDSGSVEDEILKVKWEVDAITNMVTTNIKVTIEDSNGCSTVKICRYSIEYNQETTPGEYPYTSRINCAVRQ